VQQLPTRRGFITKAATGGALLTAGSLAAPVGRLVPAAFGQDAPEVELSPDAEVASFVAGLELAAVEIYRRAGQTELLTNTARQVFGAIGDHHRTHATILNGIVGEEAPVTEPNAALLEQYGPMIENATDEAAILEAAYNLEEAMAATHLETVGEMEDSGDAGIVATVLPVESQHATLLGDLLDKDPTDYLIEFLSPEAALDPADYPAK
jgi:rubrerythrin